MKRGAGIRTPIFAAAMFAACSIAEPSSAESRPDDELLLMDASSALLSSDDLSGVRGALLRGGVITTFGLTPLSRAGGRFSALPAAPNVNGLSPTTEVAVKTTMNDVVPLVLTTLGGEIPVAGPSDNAAPLLAGFSFLPASGTQ